MLAISKNKTNKNQSASEAKIMCKLIRPTSHWFSTSDAVFYGTQWPMYIRLDPKLHLREIFALPSAHINKKEMIYSYMDLC